MDYLTIMFVLTIVVFVGLGILLGACLEWIGIEHSVKHGRTIIRRCDNGQLIKIAPIEED